jgi:hypothetical protein
MIIDKFSEYIYEQASLFITKWRVGCFLITCLILSDSLFEVVSLTFWTSSVSQAAETISKVVDIPLYLFLLILLLSFIGSPMLCKLLVLSVIEYEYKRANPAIEKIKSQIPHVSQDFMPQYLERAVKGEKQMQRIRGLIETLLYFTILGGGLQISSGLSSLYAAMLVTTPFVIFFAIQNLFATYIGSVFFYKKLAERFSS